ncbi:hypothetical protein PRIPAC_74325 [Pristionchus pacificus]|uniref:Uncharacterized protein n=1 Tax=Pristionchus pacificus TaxID=54126 RepID=A0A454XMB3_PRIPA|nr:hypothetical protein PRIPAC_74325 [Pristionchus pacificus]|eukprot:PDM71309.1 hypothetical protein PRIPAC_37716 [Pristionchus pacificus]
MNLLPLTVFLLAALVAVAAGQKAPTVLDENFIALAKMKMKVLEQTIEINKLKKIVDVKNSQPVSLSQCEADLAAVNLKLYRIREIIG